MNSEFAGVLYNRIREASLGWLTSRAQLHFVPECNEFSSVILLGPARLFYLALAHLADVLK